MEEYGNSIPIHYADDKLFSAVAPGPEAGGPAYTRHFTQTEDFFLKLGFEYFTPRLKIHHDIARLEPEEAYLRSLEQTLSPLLRGAPEVFAGLTYFFDPQEIFKPSFYKLYDLDGEPFFYLLRLDLGFRPNYQTIVERGDNDYSHISSTNALFLEPLVLPLARADDAGGRLRLAVVKPLISHTWIGEYGRGYFRQGIWMDNDLTKFFTRLFLAPEQRLYPYYPLLCQYRTVCAMPAAFGARERAAGVQALARACDFIEPSLPAIQESLKRSSFSEDLPVYRDLKEKADQSIGAPWAGLSVRTYINENDMKEYELEEHDPAV